MSRHERTVRGTFDPTQIDIATSLAERIDQQLRKTVPEYEGLQTMKDAAGHFVWIAYFREQCPLVADFINTLREEFMDDAKAASITFEIEEMGTYEITYRSYIPEPRP